MQDIQNVVVNNRGVTDLKTKKITMIYWKVTQQSQRACQDVRKQITQMTNALGIFFFKHGFFLCGLAFLLHPNSFLGH